VTFCETGSLCTSRKRETRSISFFGRNSVGVSESVSVVGLNVQAIAYVSGSLLR